MRKSKKVKILILTIIILSFFPVLYKKLTIGTKNSYNTVTDKVNLEKLAHCQYAAEHSDSSFDRAVEIEKALRILSSNSISVEIQEKGSKHLYNMIINSRNKLLNRQQSQKARGLGIKLINQTEATEINAIVNSLKELGFADSYINKWDNLEFFIELSSKNPGKTWKEIVEDKSLMGTNKVATGNIDIDFAIPEEPPGLQAAKVR